MTIIASLRRITQLSILFAVACAIGGCAVDDEVDKGAEAAMPPDGKLDSFHGPTWHGLLQFGGPATAALSPLQRYHAWEFWLSGAADVGLITRLDTSGGGSARRKVDTVLYLYREAMLGDHLTWGPYVARNDDAHGSVWSELVRPLGAGHYRVLVKGYGPDTAGPVELVPTCSGVGCAPVAVACGLGATYQEFRDAGPFTTLRTATISAASGGAAKLTALERSQVVRAVQQSAHVDVTTAEEALARVDEQVIDVVVRTAADGAVFVAYAYGAGDNSYGAIFLDGTTTLAASIHDGDLYDCTGLMP